MRATQTLLTILVLAALTLPVMATAAPAPAEGAVYRVNYADGTGSPARGWGVYANLPGRSLDIRSRIQGWVDDPRAGPGDVQAGLGWRGGQVSTVLGYQEVDFGRRQFGGPGVDPMNTGREREDTSSVLGLGFALHR